jgi:hypothetical protein
MKRFLYTLLGIAGLAAMLLSCDKKNTVAGDNDPDDTPVVVTPPDDPDEPVTGAVIPNPPPLPEGATHYPDNHYRIVQRSAESNAFTLIVVGDGFGASHGYDDFAIGGLYDEKADFLVNTFKRNYVIRDYHHYFNIVVYYAHSPQHGVDGKGGVPNESGHYTPGEGSTSRFGSHLGDANSGVISDSLRHVAMRLTGLTDLKDVFVIFPIVGNIGGSPHFDGASGLGWTPYPYTESNPPFWMMHEFVGHVIGRLPDMYTRGGGPFNGAVKNEIDAGHAAGSLWMVDYNKNFPAAEAAPDSADVVWSPFLYEPGYKHIVGIHPGAYNQANTNIYVPQPGHTNGMCNNGVNTYDAPSRYQIWRRLQKTVGRDYSLERFFAYDTAWNVKQTSYSAAPPELNQ